MTASPQIDPALTPGLAGRTVLVTGAATGIGRATTEHLLACGARVIGLGLETHLARDLVDSVSDTALLLRETDLTDEQALRAAIAEGIARFGTLHGVVNGAAIYRTGQRLEDLSDAAWDETLAINLTAVFRVCRATLPLLRQAGGGSIVNIASVHALATVPGVPAYAATKAAVLGLSRQMALDYAIDRIRVNALIVGSVATRMTLDGFEAAGGIEAHRPLFEPTRIARIAEPAEVARTIAFLLSEAASFITGSGLVVDGGMTAKLL